MGPRLGDERSLAPGNRWLAAVVLLLVLSTVGIFAASRDTGPQEGGGGGLAEGSRLPPFAAPLAVGPVRGDVNVATRADQGSAGAVPACAVRDAGVLVSCRLTAGGPAALLLVSEGSDRCLAAVDQLERAVAARPGVRAAVVVEGGDRERTARLVRARGWRLPVAHDRDNALAGLFGAPLCPYLVLVGADGRVRATVPGLVDAARLGAALDRVRAGAR